ncbi:hypothetical protein G7046_g6851 [Stylonectria norvegica]|nr:hypothetical protein G7046_g6851 [Stylonectria norvegica]
MKPVRSLVLILGITLPAYARVPRTLTGREDWDLTKPMNGIRFERAKAISSPTPDKTSLRFSRLKNLKSKDKTRGYSALSVLGRAGHSAPLKTGRFHQNASSVGEFSTQYAIQCGWDGKPVWLLFDTGSSDTWAAQSGFECEDSTGKAHEQTACGFGRTVVNDFGHGAIDGLHFHLGYGSGEEVSGPMGKSDVSCGGLLVSEQQVGLANKTYWHGNNVTVGILGLAYPSITSAYYGRIGEETPYSAIPYTPFFTNAIAQGSIDPVFSVTIVKNSSDGVLAWGGLPPMFWNHGSYAATDLIVANLIDQDDTAWKYSFYTIIPDGLTWGLTTDTTKYPYMVDTGTTMMYLPPPLAEAIANAFEPRAVYLYQWGSYFAPCDAVAPQFAVVISGTKFWINPADMIFPQLMDPLTGYCAVAIASGGSGPFILGDVFLQNVVAVFDVGGAEMRFYSRE